MKKPLRSLLATAALAAGIIAAPTVDAATNLRYAIGLPTGALPEAGHLFAEKVKEYTGGSVTVKVFELSLLSASEMSSGVKQGVADIGYMLTPYWPAEYPHINMAGELSMLTALSDDPSGKSGLAYTGAMTEFIFNECPECMAEFAAQNQVYLGSGGSTAYWLLCTKPIVTLADLKGKRLRAGGASWSRWARAIGATPVTMPIGEVFEGLNQGVLDCSISSPPELSGVNLREIVTDITPVPGGIFMGSSGNFNRDSWRKLTDDQRQGVIRAAADLVAKASYGYFEYTRNDMADVTSKGAKLHTPDPELLATSRAVIEADMPVLGETYAKQHKVEDPQRFIDTLQPLVDKWSKLVEPVESWEDLSKLLWDELYSKLDPKTYGVK